MWHDVTRCDKHDIRHDQVPQTHLARHKAELSPVMMPHGYAEHRRMLGTPCIGWNGAAKDGRTSGCAVSGQFQSFTAQLWREGKVYQDELSSELICFKLASRKFVWDLLRDCQLAFRAVSTTRCACVMQAWRCCPHGRDLILKAWQESHIKVCRKNCSIVNICQHSQKRCAKSVDSPVVNNMKWDSMRLVSTHGGLTLCVPELCMSFLVETSNQMIYTDSCSTYPSCRRHDIYQTCHLHRRMKLIVPCQG